MEVHNVIDYIQTKKEPVIYNVAKNCSIHKIQIKLKPGTKVDDPSKLTLNDIIIECVDRNNDDHCKDVKWLEFKENKGCFYVAYESLENNFVSVGFIQFGGIFWMKKERSLTK